MSSSDDYVYDEASGEWLSPAEVAARAADGPAGEVEVRDSVGNRLADGYCVVLIQAMTVQLAGPTL